MFCDKYRCNRRFLNIFFVEGEYTNLITFVDGRIEEGTRTITKEYKCNKLWKVKNEYITKIEGGDIKETTYFYINGKYETFNNEGQLISKSYWVNKNKGICYSGKYSGIPFTTKSRIDLSSGNTVYNSKVYEKCKYLYSFISTKI